MDEKEQEETERKTKEEAEKSTFESAANDPAKRTESGTISTLDRADQIAERQARENDRREKILDREEAIAARKAVGGFTEAGSSEKEKKEETPKDYRARVEKEMAEGKTEFGN